MKHFEKWKLLLATAILFLAYSSCKKTDLQSDEAQTASSLSKTEQRFFNSNRTNDPKEDKLVQFVKSKNEKEHFVEQTVRQIGYPRWNSLSILENNKNTANSNSFTNSTNNGNEVYVIPFVRDSQNYVNATMLININQSDTSFSYLCDWQYQDTAATHMSAKDLALFLMKTDKSVFGNRVYKLTDTTIFGRNYQDKTIMYLQLSTNSNQSSNLFATVEVCYTQYVPINNGQLTGCPPGPDCPQYTSQYVCDNYTVWVDDDWGGGGDGGTGPGGTGTGGTSGGGGSTGGSTPPTCGGSQPVPFAKNNPSESNITEPCSGGGGWTPIEPEPWDDNYFTFSYTHLDNPVFVADDPVEMPAGYLFGLSNFDINTTTPIRVIGKTDPRGNTEDMQYGNNCDASGILSNMPNFTDAQLFAEVEDLFHKTSTGALETVGDVMIDRFRNSIGGQFTNATLSQAVFDNSKFQNFIVKFGDKLHLALAANNWDINQVPQITMPQGVRPAFNGLHNKFHGLQILINDTEETIIELTNFSINATTHKWTADLNITIKDHFGLDKNDALTYQNYHAGFAAWWILQHCRGYKPFETKISFKMQLQTQ